MLRLNASTLIGGHLNWQASKDPREKGDGAIIAFHLGDALDLATVMSEHYRSQMLEQLEGLVEQNKISWIQPGSNKWGFDLQTLAEEIEGPDLKSLDWFKGLILVRPEFRFRESQAMSSQKYQTVIQFRITLTLLNTVNANLDLLREDYRIISHLERSLRDLIETKLRAMHGDHWWKRGVPEQVRKDCEQRKQEKEKPSEIEYHPINYAHVDNYKTIIIKRDNWDTVFGAVFGDKTKVEASFSWVANVRDAIAHTRPITNDDHKMFVAGAHWLQSAIDKDTSI